jgi:hypothetical protein
VAHLSSSYFIFPFILFHPMDLDLVLLVFSFCTNFLTTELAGVGVA